MTYINRDCDLIYSPDDGGYYVANLREDATTAVYFDRVDALLEAEDRHWIQRAPTR